MKLHRISGSDATLAILQASGKVRNGMIFNGAPSHIVVELLIELERAGFYLAVAAPPLKPASTRPDPRLPAVDDLT